MSEPTYTYVATIKREITYSTEYLMVGFGRRPSNEPDKVVGLRSEGEDTIWGSPRYLEGLVLDSLTLRAFYGDINRDIVWSDWCYHPYCVDARTAQNMTRTLDKIHRQLKKEAAHEPGDQLVAVCKLFRIKEVAFWRSPDYEWRTGSRWSFHTVNEGRNILREEVQEMLEQAAA